MSEKEFLVVIETQRVKNYLFASPILRETRGASMILDRLNRGKTKEFIDNHKGEEIYLGGGSGRVLFESENEAEAFKDEIRRLYQEETLSARVSVEVVQRKQDKNDPTKKESFPAWMARGVFESQKNKLARREALPLLGGRWIRPCSSCGRAPAQEVIKFSEQEVHRLCGACLKKRDEIRSFYRDVKRNRDMLIPASKWRLKNDYPKFVLTTLVDGIESKFGSETQLLLPRDLDHIADQSKPSNYIGFIYADGNRMGEVIKSMGKKFPDDEQAKQAYKAFSAIVDQSTREAAVEAVLEKVEILEEKTPRNEDGCFVPAEFVLAGGDDLILVVPAHTALDVAFRFIELFQDKTECLQQEWKKRGELSELFEPHGLTTSAGVVLAHASFPASQLMDLALDLMKMAKRKAADLAQREKQTAEGTLDFMVLHSPGSETAKQRRKWEYTRHINGGPEIKLTERPYTATEAFKLLDRIRGLRKDKVPRNKLEALYLALFQEVLPAQFDAMRIKESLSRTGDLQRSESLQELIRKLNEFPYRRQETSGSLSTPLTEIVELYDFVRQHNSSSE